MSGIPNFFVIGAAKAGTTSLYHYLAQHPDIYLPPIKETNHFAMADIDEERLDPVYRKDVQLDLPAYIKGGMKRTVHITHVERKMDYEALFASHCHEKALGEISNSYLLCPSAVPAIRERHPSAKLLVFLRNPVRRAWSHYLMNCREGKVRFDDFILEAETDHTAAHKGWGVNHQYLEAGLYGKQMTHVLKEYPAHQVRWFLFEDFVGQPKNVLAEVCKYLEVSPNHAFDASKKSNEAGVPRSKWINQLLVNSGLLHGLKTLASESQKEWIKSKLYRKGNKVAKMSDEEENFLTEFYRADVERLSRLLSFNFNQYWNLS